MTFPYAGMAQHDSSIDIIGSVDYGYRYLKTSNSDQQYQDIINTVNEIEIGSVNWRAGFNYNHQLARSFYIKSGLRFAQTGYKTKRRNLVWPDGMTVNESQLFFDYLFIEIPIVGRWEFNQKKLSPFVELGVAPSIFLTYKTTSVLNDTKTTTFHDEYNGASFNPIHIVGIFSFGVQYAINDRYKIFAQPSFRFHLSPTTSSTIIKEQLYNYGLEFGVRRVFGQAASE